MEYVTLNNGVKMPILGFGVYQIPDPVQCEQAVLDALNTGYRMIDTAQAYFNEEAVGNAIKKSGIPREDIFIITKVWITNAGEEKARQSIFESMKKLQTDYIDLVLIHQPFNDYYGTYRALEKLYKEGKIRAIGVANFYPDRLVDLIKYNEIVPAVNQIETHVFQQQTEARNIMDKYNIQHQSWGPFAEGKNNIFTNEVLTNIGSKYNKTAAQVALRYLIQRKVVIIPKSIHTDRIKQNFDIFDFQLTQQDMDDILKLDTKQTLFFSHYDPQFVEYISTYKLN